MRARDCEGDILITDRRVVLIFNQRCHATLRANPRALRLGRERERGWTKRCGQTRTSRIAVRDVEAKPINIDSEGMRSRKRVRPGTDRQLGAGSACVADRHKSGSGDWCPVEDYRPNIRRRSYHADEVGIEIRQATSPCKH